MALGQTPGKRPMWGCSHALLELGQDPRHIAPEQGRHGQVQAGENTAVDHAGGRRRQRAVAVCGPVEPVNPPVLDLPTKYSRYAVAAVDVQVTGGAAGGNFTNEFGRAFNVIKWNHRQ